jgi:hypothetical protein
MSFVIHLGLSCVGACDRCNVCSPAASLRRDHERLELGAGAQMSSAVTTPPRKLNKMAWARDALARANLTQRDLARVWSHGRELGVTLARWVSRRPVGCARHAIRQSGEDALLPDVVSEEQRPVTAQNTPPIPTVHMSPARNGKWHLLLHLELSAVAIGKIVSGLEEAAAERRAPASPPPPT